MREPSKLITKNLFVQTRIINNKIYAVLHNDVYLIDEVGYEIWKTIDGSKNQDEIITAISSIYQMESSDIKNDVESFISSMINAKLIEQY